MEQPVTQIPFRRLYENIVASATEAIITIDETQRIILFNQAAEDIFGYGREEVLGGSLEKLMPEQYRSQHAQDVSRFRREEHRPRKMAAGRMVLGRRKNGDTFPAEASISRVVDEDRVVMTVILRDVSEREEAMRRLLDSEARYHSLADQLPGFAYAMEGAPDGDRLVLTYASHRAEKLLGHPVASLYDDSDLWLQSVDPDSRQEILDAHLHCLREGEPIDKVVRLLHEDGEVRIVLNRAIRAMVLDPATGRDRPVVQGLMVDITERERLQQKLIQSERLAEAGRIAAIVAHEVNSPITAIRGCLETLLESGSIEPMLKEYVEVALSEARRVGALAMQLREYSRPSREKRHPMQLNELVSDLVYMVRQELNKHGITLTIEMDPELPLVQGDPSEIKQVLWNLLTNAWDAMPEGGHLVVRTSRTGEGPGSRARFEVVDTGGGIPDEIQPRIFGMFFTTKEHSTSGGGAGLGLSISQTIVERHKGRISFETTSGKGTRFVVELPAIYEDSDNRPIN